MRYFEGSLAYIRWFVSYHPVRRKCLVFLELLLTSITGPNYLSPPDAGFTLSRVVLGRGTQNYTCADSTANSIPVSQGAVADLYDASCLAAKHPELLHRLPGALVSLNKNLIGSAVSIISKMSRADILVGHHYFAPNNTVPVFDFRMKKPQPWILMGKRDQSVPAVTTASKGIATEPNGAVDWLRIKAIASMSVDFKLAYRVQTAGGKPATTCQGQPESFEIQYASEYCK